MGRHNRHKTWMRWIFGAGLLGLFALALLPVGRTQQIHRNPFESEEVSWSKGQADVPFQEEAHSRTNEGARDGQRSEFLRLLAKQGSFIHYNYPTGQAPISEELSVSLWVKGNRPGVQLLARVVLPHERDPKSLDDRLTTFLRGDVYRLAGRWQQLQLLQITKLTQEQQQLMQEQLRRPLDFRDAYIDSLILNVYGGPGLNEVWIDNLEIGPILDPTPYQPTAQSKDPGSGASEKQPAQRRTLAVQFSSSQLLVGGKRFFFRGIRYTDTPLRVLRNAGFNTIWFDYSASPALLREATDMGFWLVPRLPVIGADKQLVSRNVLGHEVARFPEANSVLFWDLGGSLASEQAAVLAHSAQIVKAADPLRPLGADVWDGFQPYARQVQLLGAHRWPLNTSLELTGYRDWLEQRRLLASPANPNVYTWTWIQTHTPEFFTQMLYDQSAAQPFDEPIGPQPAQIRLLTYTALSAGCRGIGFWSDRFLANTHQGRDRLQAVALINKELEMLEPLLVTIEGDPMWSDTSEKDVKVAVFRTAKGILAIPMWLGMGAQYVPGQTKSKRLKVTVPQVPQGTQAWEVTPGEVRGLRVLRIAGGMQVELEDFGLTTALVFTSDTDLIARFQVHAQGLRQLAAQWTYDQAVQELQKAVKVQKELEQIGQAVPKSGAWLKEAQSRLIAAKTQYEHHLFADAYREAQQALRPIRLLMRMQWENATRRLDAPVSVPYAVSYYTLPRFWRMAQQIRNSTPAENVLPGGDFELAQASSQSAWYPQNTTLDEVDLHAERVGPEYYTVPDPKAKSPTAVSKQKIEPRSGKLCARLRITPKKDTLPPGALERTYLAVNSPAVRLQPGTLVRISGWILIPEPIKASVDGALFFDSAGGEPLAIRQTREIKEWKQLTLYRRVPASGVLQVTIALSGIGTVYYDDIRIEPLTPMSETEVLRVSGQ